MSKILVADDDPAVTEMIVEFLEKRHHSAQAVYDGREAYHHLRFHSYDLAILDWQMPSLSGLDACRQYRDGGGKTPILMLTGENSGRSAEVKGDGPPWMSNRNFSKLERLLCLGSVLREYS